MTTNGALQNAYSYLRTIQETQYKAKGMLPQVYDEAWLEAVSFALRVRAPTHPLTQAYFQQVEELRATISELPTPYVNPHHHRILVRLLRLTEYAASVVLTKDFKERYHVLLINPPLSSSREPYFRVSGADAQVTFIVSTLPTGEINARVIPYRDEPVYFVLFETQLFSLLNLMAKCIAPFFRQRDEESMRLAAEPMIGFVHRMVQELQGLDDPDSISMFTTNAKALVEKDKETQALFCECLAAYCVHGDVEHYVRPKPLSMALQEQAVRVLDSAELFLMGHEYAHALLSHVGPDRKVEDQLAKSASHSWTLEYEADCLGLDIASEAVRSQGMHGEHNSASFIGGYFALLCIDLLEKVDAIARPLSAESSHPPAQARIENIDRWLKERFAGHHHMRQIQSNTSTLRLIVDTLWSTAGESAVRALAG
jgi:hypothetical protein